MSKNRTPNTGTPEPPIINTVVTLAEIVVIVWVIIRAFNAIFPA